MNVKAVQSFEAKDGSLHRTPLDAEIRDATDEVRTLLKPVSEQLAGVAPYSDDLRCNGFFESWHFEDGIKHLLANDLENLGNLVEAAKKLERLRKMKDQKG